MKFHSSCFSMDFLHQIEAYWFLTQETKMSIQQAVAKGFMTPGVQKQIVDRCEKAKQQLAEEEVKLLEAIHEAESQLLHEADSVLHQARAEVENTQRAEEDKNAEDLENQLQTL